ncbi:MAG: indole-3-glycerol phosphate synthase TrpC [Endomicrobiia bacterium]
MSNYLNKIVTDKKETLNKKKKELPIEKLKEFLKNKIEKRNFKEAISKPNRINIIGEIKKASPSAGVIRKDFDVRYLAKRIENSGVDAISVLTEEKYFHGDLFHLINVKDSTKIPILRKDFIIDEYQIYESKVFGADAVLLISEILTRNQLDNFLQLCKEINLDVIVELHSENQLEKVLSLPVEIIGINNRNLENFSVNIETTIKLRNKISLDKIVVSESGIKKREDILRLKESNINAVLIGESIMRSQNIEEKIKEFIGEL